MNRQDRLERTLSMAQNKGLLNNPGENNCFLNSAVQVSLSLKSLLKAHLFYNFIALSFQTCGFEVILEIQ